jgi:sugar porter (SP) family MFS transporter
MKIKPKYYFIIVAVVAAFAGILFGYDTGVISGAILFIAHEFDLSPFSNGLVVSAVLFGAFLGALISGHISDWIGRKRLLIKVAIVFVIGSLMTAFVHSVPLLIVGRAIVGIAIGIASYTAPLYISEVAPAKHRGALVSLNQLAVSFGILVSYIVDYSFAAFDGWRWMLGLGAVPAVALCVGMILLPYSPRWAFSKLGREKAQSILSRIRSEEGEIKEELDHIEETTHIEKGSWRHLFSTKVRPALTIAVGLAIIQQFTGINTILYYAPTIFTMTGFEGPVAAILATMGIGAAFVIFTIVSLPLIDRWGRRPLLLLGTFGMTVCLAVMSIAFGKASEEVFYQWTTLIAMIAYIAFFAVSLGPIMWLMIAEVFPLRVRGLGASIATCMNWLSNMLVALSFLTLIKWFGASGTFLIYAIIGALSLIFIFLRVPETRGVSLEKIEKNLLDGKPTRDLGK